MIEAMRAKIAHWYHTEHDKLKVMTAKQKIGYITTYYKGVFFGLFCLALLGVYIGDIVIQAQKESLVQGFITNDDWNLFSAEAMEQEYGEYIGLEKNQTVVFDDGLYIDMGGEMGSDYTAASNGKLLAFVTTQELDVLITTRDIYEYYSGQLPMADLKEMLPADLFEALKDRMLTQTDEAGKTIYAALDMTGSRYVAGSEYADETGVKNNYFLLVPNNSLRKEHTTEFIRYCFMTGDGVLNSAD